MDYETFEKAYSSKQVAEMLNSSQPTINRWSISLEKAGYIFIKGDNNKRLFVQEDIERLKLMKKMVDENNISTVNASKFIVEQHSEQLLTDRADTTQPNNELKTQDNQYSIIDYINQLNEDHQQEIQQLKQELFAKLDEQEQNTKQREKERLEQHDKLLMQSIRESQETKQMLKSIQEQNQLLIEQSATKEKKSFLSRLFGK